MIKNDARLESWSATDGGFRKRFFRGHYRMAVSFMTRIGRLWKEGPTPDLVLDKDGLWVVFNFEEESDLVKQRELAVKIDHLYNEVLGESDPPLTKEEISEVVPGLRGWSLGERSLQRTIILDSFKTALEFANRVAAIGVGTGHLPDILIHKNRVDMVISGRHSRGVTAADVNLAMQVSEVVLKLDDGQGIRNR